MQGVDHYLLGRLKESSADTTNPNNDDLYLVATIASGQRSLARELRYMALSGANDRRGSERDSGSSARHSASIITYSLI